MNLDRRQYFIGLEFSLDLNMIHLDIVLEEDRTLADRFVRALRYFENCAAAIAAYVSGTCQSFAYLRYAHAFDPHKHLFHQIHTLINIESISSYILSVRPIDVPILTRVEQPVNRVCLKDELDGVRPFTLAEKAYFHSSWDAQHGC